MISSKAQCNHLNRKVITKQRTIKMRMYEAIDGPWPKYVMCLSAEDGDPTTAIFTANGMTGRYVGGINSDKVTWEEHNGKSISTSQ